jgi:hypothetical protein
MPQHLTNMSIRIKNEYNSSFALASLGNGRCDHLLLPAQKDKTFVFDSLSVAPKGRQRMLEAGLRYESIHSMERNQGA